MALINLSDFEQIFRLLLLAGSALVSIMLVVLMVTRWGQAQLLSKCVALSLLTHLLMVGYAQIYMIARGSSDEPGLATRVGIMDDSLPSGTLPPTAPPKPWESPSVKSAAPAAPTETPLSQPQDRVGLPRQFTPDSQPAIRREINPDTLSQEEGSAVRGQPRPNELASPTRAGSPTATTLSDVPKARKQEPPQVGVPSTADLTRAAVPGLEAAPLPPASTLEASQLRDSGARAVALSNVPTAGDQTDLILGAKDFLGPASNKGRNARERSDPRNPAELRPAAGGATSIAGDVPRRAGDGGAMPQIYGNRERGKRAGLSERFGGSLEAQAAAAAALDWLARHQEPDGRFSAVRTGGGVERKVGGQDRKGAGADADTAITGLAVLALLADGQTHLEGERREVIQHGLEFLIRAQARDGNLGGGASTFALMYCHGMATLALSEAYAVTGDTRLKAPVQRAVQYTIAAQSPTTGGWRYQPGDDGDMSQFGWQVMALRSAEQAGIEVPTTTKLGMQKFLRSVSKGGLASYRPGEKPTRTMTAEALACRIFLDVDRTDEVLREAADFVMEEPPTAGEANEYYWYYATLGLHQLQDAHWRDWNRALQRKLLETQIKKGEDKGSWPSDTIWGGHGGRVYTTAMNAMSLEVYYRYLPLYGARGGK